MLNNIQQDYSNRLENKLTEVINRIVMEHEERVKAQDEIKSNLEISLKLQSEKLGYEKEEIRERTHAIESLLRAEITRKDEAIRQLNVVFEN